MSDFPIPFGREQDRGYRRGFDQGVYETLIILGLDDDTLQDLAWKKKIAKWRHSSPGKTFKETPFNAVNVPNFFTRSVISINGELLFSITKYYP